jgi:acyl-CoA synthetase (AMP-forming)/AMP-acid ligase II
MHPGQGRTLADIVAGWASWSPDQVALIDSGGARTWGWLQARIDAFAGGLAAHGVRRGAAVAVAEVPVADMVALYLATARAGAVLVPLNLRWREAELLRVRDVVTPVLALAAAEHQAVVGAAVPAGTTTLVSGPDAPWGDQLASAGGALPEPAGGYDDPHLLLFTSGTTGRPKAAVLGQRRSIGDAAAAALASGVRAGDRLLGYQPLFHTGGWDFLKQYLLVGGSAVLMSSFDPDGALELIERFQCTSLFAVPLVLLRMMESPRFAHADLSSLRRLMFASYDPSDLIQTAAAAFRSRGARELMLEHVYGQTEAGSFITTLRWEDARPEALESVGTPVPGVTVGLLDPQLRPVAPGEIGEVCVKGETVMLGYLGDPAATADAFRGGWLHTGDLGRRDANGQLRLSGRLKQMVRTAGENVYPKEVEQVLAGHPQVTDCAVFGIPDARWDERVVAVVVVGDSGGGAGEEAAPREEELIAYLKARLAGYKVPRKIQVVPAIPKTPAGKTARQLLPSLLGSADADG